MATNDRVIGDDGEPHLPGTVHGRLHSALAHLQVTDDILQHDDGVVDHESDRERQPHKRDVIQAVAEQIHHPEGSDYRHRQGHAGNDGGGEIADKEENDHHHQHQGEQQGKLDIVNGSLDRQAAVMQDLHLRGCRQVFRERGQIGFHRPRHFQGIGPRLFIHRQENGLGLGGGREEPGGILVVLHAVDDLGDIRETDRPTVAHRHDDIAILARLVELAVGLQGQGARRAAQLAHGLLAFWALTAAATSFTSRSRDFISSGSSWMRTAYFWLPRTWTCATPRMVERR